MKIAPKILEAIAKDYLDGISLRALQDRYGLSYGTIRRRLMEAEVPIRRQGPHGYSVPGKQVG